MGEVNLNDFLTYFDQKKINVLNATLQITKDQEF